MREYRTVVVPTLTKTTVVKVISGGQTGADMGGLRAGKALKLRTGGWVPRGCKTQAGPNPRLVHVYGCDEHASDKYPPRTFANVRDSDATIRFAKDFGSPGELCTLKAIRQYHKPHLDVAVTELAPYVLGISEAIMPIRRWLYRYEIRVLNVAGNSERTCPGIELLVKNFLVAVLREEPDYDHR